MAPRRNAPPLLERPDHRLPSLQLGAMSRGRDPEAQHAAALILEHAAVPLDDRARAHVVLVTRDQGAPDAELTGHDQCLSKHLGRVPAAPRRRSDVITDVTTALEEDRCQAMSDADPAEELVAVDPPELRGWDVTLRPRRLLEPVVATATTNFANDSSLVNASLRSRR